MVFIRRIPDGTFLPLWLSTMPAMGFMCNGNATGLAFGGDIFTPWQS